jgi:hypothetical protein
LCGCRFAWNPAFHFLNADGVIMRYQPQNYPERNDHHYDECNYPFHLVLLGSGQLGGEQSYYDCGFDCPIMKDSRPKQIAIVKTIVNKGSHITTLDHI